MYAYEDYTFDIKPDVLRIKTQIQQYSQSQNDEYGWQYIKDYVRCCFIYDTPNKFQYAL